MAFNPDCLEERDAGLIKAFLPWLRRFNSIYLRLRRFGVENIPREPALFVSNHNGGIAGPDVICSLATLWETLGPESPIYALAHDFAMRQFTTFGRLIQKFGAMRACPENARRVFAAGGHVLVYPGGDIEAYRHSMHRDKIVFGSRTGFVKVAQKEGVPIVPMVAHGAHRSAYIFTDGAKIAQAIRLKVWNRTERFPLAFALPWGLAVGPWIPYLPLPFPISLRVLKPIHVKPSEHPAEVQERIRGMMQASLDEMANHK